MPRLEMPYDVVDGEPSPHKVQLVTEIARECLMHAIIERCITLRLVCFEGTEGCEGTLSGFSGALIVWLLLASTSAPAPQQRCSIGRRGERQEHSGAPAKGVPGGYTPLSLGTLNSTFA